MNGGGFGGQVDGAVRKCKVVCVEGSEEQGVAEETVAGETIGV